MECGETLMLLRMAAFFHITQHSLKTIISSAICSHFTEHLAYRLSNHGGRQDFPAALRARPSSRR